MIEHTIFHRILSKEIPASVVYEDDEVLAFKDIHPKAATHLLFIPKHFVASIADVTPETAHIPGMLILKAQKFAEKQGISGYKLTFHVGKGGGQEVMYLHLHFLSDERLEAETSTP
jgi:histidine triad (HIT) family protein